MLATGILLTNFVYQIAVNGWENLTQIGHNDRFGLNFKTLNVVLFKLYECLSIIIMHLQVDSMFRR